MNTDASHNLARMAQRADTAGFRVAKKYLHYDDLAPWRRPASAEEVLQLADMIDAEKTRDSNRVLAQIILEALDMHEKSYVDSPRNAWGHVRGTWTIPLSESTRHVAALHGAPDLEEPAYIMTAWFTSAAKDWAKKVLA